MQELDKHEDVLIGMKEMCKYGDVFNPDEYRKAWHLIATNEEIIAKIKEIADELCSELLLEGTHWEVSVHMDMSDGQIYVTPYTDLTDCAICDQQRLIAPQTGCCRECDEKWQSERESG